MCTLAGMAASGSSEPGTEGALDLLMELCNNFIVNFASIQSLQFCCICILGV